MQPWIHARPSMQSFHSEILPLLISRQHKGLEGVFGPTAWKRDEGRERLQRVPREMDGGGVAAMGRRLDCNNVSTWLGCTLLGNRAAV